MRWLVLITLAVLAAAAAVFLATRGPTDDAAKTGAAPRTESALKKKCAAGEAEACAELGDLYATALGGPLLEVRQRACELGSARACTKLGRMLREGDYPHRVNVDPSGATAAYEHGCTLGDAAGCLGFGDALLYGRGTRVDRARAAEAFPSACSAGEPEGCERAKKLGP